MTDEEEEDDRTEAIVKLGILLIAGVAGLLFAINTKPLVDRFMPEVAALRECHDKGHDRLPAALMDKYTCTNRHCQIYQYHVNRKLFKWPGQSEGTPAPNMPR